MTEITGIDAANSHNFAHDLEREARLFAARSGNGEEAPPRSWIVVDLEFAFDRDAHGGYRTAEGSDAEQKVRWPFHRLAAVSWMSLRFVAGAPVPEVEGPFVMTADAHDERAMAEALFDVLARAPDAVLTTWGGEARDLAVLRRCASTHDLLLPPQLIDGSPNARERLDLCRASCVQADSVHLPELAAAMGVPAKPSPSTEIGKLVERGVWAGVREQVAADVLTTAVLAVRYLAAYGRIACHRGDSAMAIADAAAQALPTSQFVTRSFAPWARGQKAASGLKGVIYRAA